MSNATYIVSYVLTDSSRVAMLREIGRSYLTIAG